MNNATEKTRQSTTEPPHPKICSYVSAGINRSTLGCTAAARHYFIINGLRVPVCDQHLAFYATHKWEHYQYTTSELSFPEELANVVVKVKQFFPEPCEHKQMLVDDELRTVECGECGLKLDPIQCIIEIAREERMVDYKLAAMADYERKQREERQRAKDLQLKRALRRSNINPKLL